MTRLPALVAAAVLIAAPALAGEPLTENTRRLAAGEASPPATIADAAWLEGSWTSPGFGGVVEEVWSAPSGGAMMGMFRLVKDGAPVFYELFALSEENGSLILRLKHFHADMKGWEEQDETVDFPLVERAEGVLRFDGLTFRRDDQDQITVFLAISEDDSVHEVTFQYRRSPPRGDGARSAS